MEDRFELITIIWQISTFSGLIALFIYLACLGKRHQSRLPVVNDQVVSATPSYRHFAPPSYSTAIKNITNNSRVPRVSIVPEAGMRNLFESETEPVAVDLSDHHRNLDVEACTTHL